MERLPHLGRRAILGGAVAAALPHVSRAQGTKPVALRVGYTATPGFLGAFIAKDQGMFAAHGLNATLTLVALSPTIPSALMGGSLDIGGPSPTVLLQANDSGLDLVVVAGVNYNDRTIKNSGGIFARTGSGIGSARDMVGKKVGVPGLGAFVHVLMRQWLIDGGVDPAKVAFLEVSLPQMNDVLRAGTIDVCATSDPFYSRILAAKTGVLIGSYLEHAPLGLPGSVYAGTRDWVAQHATEVAGFRAAIAEASAFAAANPDRARQIMNAYLKLPPDLAATVELPQLQPVVTPEQMQFWIKAMTDQDMLQNKPNMASLFAA